MEKKWEELTPEEKREERFKQWLAPPDIEFISPEAEKAYFEKFYWHTLKKVILAFIDEGLMVSLVAEGRYEMRLETIKDVPKGWTWWHFDQTDMAKAKKALGGVACIAGNVPSSLLYTGTPQDVKEYCRKLIEVCGEGGGYILTAASSVEQTTPENLRAFMEAAKEYGVYK
jgi:uroporphyrinogen-III decarboxylase